MNSKLIQEIAQDAESGMSSDKIKEKYKLSSDELNEAMSKMEQMSMLMIQQMTEEQRKSMLTELGPIVQKRLDENPNLSEHDKNLMKQIISLCELAND